MSFSQHLGNGVAKNSAPHTVVVAHRFRLERELTAYALRKRRPATTVLTTDPSGLDDLCQRLSPVLVIYDDPDELVPTSCSSWIWIDPFNPGYATVCIGEQVRDHVSANLDAVLDFFDESVRLRTGT